MAFEEWDHGGTAALDIPHPPSGRGSPVPLSKDAGEARVRPDAPVGPLCPPEERPGEEQSPPPEGHGTAPADLDADQDQSRRGFVRRHPFGTLLGALVAATAAAAGYLYWDNAAHYQSTDDAFIAARQFGIAPQVSGDITAVPVTDNQEVPAGAVIARIDARSYRIALEQDLAQVASARAGIQNVDAQINVQQAQIDANQAQVVQAQASLVFATQQAARYADLARHGAGSVQDAQQYSSQLRQQRATLASTQASLTVAQRQIDALKAQRENAYATLAQAEAQRGRAQLNLSYTTVTAAQAGRVVQLSAAVGEYVQPGTDLTMFVPDRIWVTANFKETQLDQLRPGQPVTLHIDAYPERTIRGHVASVQPGSGTAFSLLPAENATGNYVKIVQRVPVKIIIDNPPADVALGPGMSVDPTVRVNPNPSLYERLRSWL